MAEKKSKLAEIKTKPTSASVEDFINNVKDEQKRKDSFVLLEMMKKATGEEPVLWSRPEGRHEGVLVGETARPLDKIREEIERLGRYRDRLTVSKQ